MQLARAAAPGAASRPGLRAPPLQPLQPLARSLGRMRAPGHRCVPAPPLSVSPAAAAAAAPAAREQAALPASSADTLPLGAWLDYCWRLNQEQPLSAVDATVERLRRQLGWAGRWAWEWEHDAPADSGDDWEDAAGEEGQPGTSGTDPVDFQSSRSGDRRSGSRRTSRSRAQAGAAAREQRARPWAQGDAVLPAELQDRRPGQLLTAEQEAWLGEQVQAAQRALALVQQQPAAPAKPAKGSRGVALQRLQHPAAAAAAPSAAGGSRSVAMLRLRQQLPAAQLREEAVLRRGAAAQQLLFDANLALLSVARRQLVGGAQLPAGLHQDLCIAGRDALWRAAAGYKPTRGTRFSTYAVTAILNGMRDALAAHRCPSAHVPYKAAAWAQRVRSAAVALQQQQQQPAHVQQQPEGQQQQQPVREPAPLEVLAAAAGLTPRQTMHGLAAARGQRVAAVGDAERGEAEVVPEGDRASAEAAAAREAVELILARLRPRKHATVLRLRHRLDDMGSPAAGLGASSVPAGEVAELDFASLGRRLGVSRQRAQQLYHAAVACARQEAAAAGLA